MPSLEHDRVRDTERENRLTAALRGSRIGVAVHAFNALPSTMDACHALAASGASDGTLVVAGSQTQARGRLGRSWASPEGGLYVSALLHPKRAAAEVAQLSLVAGLAAAEAIRQVAPALAPSVKWPNDVLVSGRKLVGILIESKENGVVVGIGINVDADAGELPEMATSLRVLGAKVDVDSVLIAFARHFSDRVNLWEASGFDPIRDALRPLMSGFGQVIRLSAGTDAVEGQAVDLDERGRLVIRLDSGLLRSFDVGEVTVLR